MKLDRRTRTLGCVLSLALVGCGGAHSQGDSSVLPVKPIPAPVLEDGAVPAFSDLPNAVDAPGDVDTQALRSQVSKVTVYSDRARVTRRATAELGTEATVFAFDHLPGWVDDGSVRVSASAGRIVDVRVERSFLARASDAKWRKAEDYHKTLTEQLAALDDELQILNAQKSQIEAIKAFSLEKITKDTTIGAVSVNTYSDVLRFISESLRETAQARRRVQKRRDKLSPEYLASTRRLAELKSLMKLEETRVLVTLQSSQPSQSAIELTYMMPGATWEPKHELRVSTKDAQKVEVISFAVVTQTSGEDWGDAQLFFSTQSSVQSVRIPELEALTLGDTHTATRILTSKTSSFTRAQSAYSSQNRLWNKVQQKSSHRQRDFERSYQSNLEYLQIIQAKTVKIFQTLQKRGTTAHYQAMAAPRVRGDGHPVRMRIGYSELSSKQKLVAVPEQSLNAARTLQMSNSTKQAFLPGNVALYQDGTFLGMTEIDFIAQGESFSLFVGVADHIKLSRRLDKKHSAVIRRKRTRMKIAYMVTLENLSKKATNVSLADRIPVSENKDIKIDNIKISAGAKPDNQGILHWEVTLQPNEKRQYRISYQVEYPPELVLDAQRNRKSRRRAPNSPARRYKIEDQLMDLEEAL